MGVEIKTYRLPEEIGSLDILTRRREEREFLNRRKLPGQRRKERKTHDFGRSELESEGSLWERLLHTEELTIEIS